MAWSRAHIIVLSENSIKKMWPKFELERAYTESVEQQKEFIIIKYGNILSADAPGLVQQILDSRVYIQWPEVNKTRNKKVKNQQAIFWARLAAKLYGRRHTGRINDILDDSLEPRPEQRDLLEVTPLIQNKYTDTESKESYLSV